MAIKFIPFSSEVSLTGQKAWEAEVIEKLEMLELVLMKLERQLEFLTEEHIETLDEDER